MADDKNIRFRAVLDAADFDRGMSDLQRKMRQMQQEMSRMQSAQRTVSSDPVVGRFAKEFFDKTQQQSGQQLMSDIQKQRQEIQNTRSKVQEKSKELKILQEELKLKKESKEADQESLKTLEKKIQLQQRLMNNLNRLGSRQAQDLGAMTETAQMAGIDVGMGQQAMGPISAERIGQLRGRAANVRAYRGMGFGRGTSRALSLLGGPMAVAGGIGAAVGFAGQVGSSVYDELAEKDRRIGMAMGTAGQAGSTEIQRALRGQGIENVYFSEERERAFGTAEREFESRRRRDMLRNASGGYSGAAMIGGGTLMALGGLASLTGIGAGVGVPMMGAGKLMMGAGAVGKATQFATDKSFREPFLNTDEYQTRLTQEEMQSARALEQANRYRDPRKKFGFDFLRQNEGMFNQFQQTFGETDSMKAGGLIQAFNQQGMTGQTALRIAQAQQSAAGMTIGAGQTGDVRTAYELQQGGMTNAGRAMGLMRGLSATFGEKATEDSMKQLFSEAFSTGITDSGMVEEIRTFTNASLDLAQQTGMRVEEAAQEVTKGMVGDYSAMGMRGQQGARAIERGLSTAGGASLDYKLAFAGSEQGQEMLGGMTGTPDVLQFANLDINNISENNPVVQSMMEKMGIDDIDEFRRRKAEFDIAGGARVSTTRNRFLDFTKKLSGMSGREKSAYMQGEGRKEYQEILANLEAENPAFKAQFGSQMQLLGRYAETLNPEEQLTEFERRYAPGGGGGDLFGDMRRRGAGQLTTALEGTRADDQAFMMDMANQPSEGGQSPIDMLRDSASNYDAATSRFSEAVDKIGDILAKNSLTTEDRESIVGVLKAINQSGSQAQGQAGLDYFSGSINPNAPKVKPTTGGN